MAKCNVTTGRLAGLVTSENCMSTTEWVVLKIRRKLAIEKMGLKKEKKPKLREIHRFNSTYAISLSSRK